MVDVSVASKLGNYVNILKGKFKYKQNLQSYGLCLLKTAEIWIHKTGAPSNIIRYHYKKRQKGGDLTQSYDKSPYTNRNVKRVNNATKKFD